MKKSRAHSARRYMPMRRCTSMNKVPLRSCCSTPTESGLSRLKYLIWPSKLVLCAWAPHSAQRRRPPRVSWPSNTSRWSSIGRKPRGALASSVSSRCRYARNSSASPNLTAATGLLENIAATTEALVLEYILMVADSMSLTESSPSSRATAGALCRNDTTRSVPRPSDNKPVAPSR